MSFHINQFFSRYWSAVAVLQFVRNSEQQESKPIFTSAHGEVSLLCVFGRRADKMRWTLQRRGERNPVEIFDFMLGARSPGYQSECNVTDWLCSLKIPRADGNSAGRYAFQHGLAGQRMETSCIYEVVVGDLECKSNLRSNQIMLGESDSSMEPDILKRSCSFRYSGNYNGSMNFVWMKSKVTGSITRDKLINATSSVRSGNGTITTTTADEVKVTNDMHGVIFECLLKNVREVAACELPKMYVQYVKNSTEKLPPMNFPNRRGVGCHVDKSESVECSYNWYVRRHHGGGGGGREEDGVVLTIENKKDLSVDHLVTTGTYECLATCDFVIGEVCTFRGTSFDLVGEPETSTCTKNVSSGKYSITTVVFGIMAAVLLVGLVVTAVVLRKKRAKKRPSNGHDVSMPLSDAMVNQKKFEVQ